MATRDLSLEEYYQTLDITPPIEQIDLTIKNNIEFINDKFSKCIEITRKIIDIELFLALKYISPLNNGLAGYEPHTEITKTINPILLKIFFIHKPPAYK